MAEKDKWRHFTRGAAAGGLSAILFQPFDVIRTHQQGSFGRCPNLSVRESVRRLASENGVAGLWRGTTPTLLRVCGGAGLYFSMLHQLDAQNLTVLGSFCAGAFARSFAGFVMSPLTIVKARMEWAAPSHQSGAILAEMRAMAAEHGVRGLYKGIIPTLLRDVPFSGLYVTLYSRLKSSVDCADEHRVAVNFACGVAAGVASTVIVHPADVVKTRMQLDDARLTVRATLRRIYIEEGPKGFLRGVVPRVFKRTFSTALTWSMYEYMSARA
ncbi:Mitochondrial Carrier (MC) Family [Achlya hypogyna]|uniref:Mitochondrial Carrier (MC) Family n=1 Tax=Achlya hypogyna TaxID=1202772 RepID=A0A1V9YGC7_ACHHY|nr:Mitochondrial Carrier (MC) Family [Achlya hypogyna]